MDNVKGTSLQGFGNVQMMYQQGGTLVVWIEDVHVIASVLSDGSAMRRVPLR